MKKLMLIALLMVVMAGSAFAQAIPATILECRTGVIAEGTEVDITGDVIVTAVRYNGFACSMASNVLYGSIWVYTGSAPTVVAGDKVEILSAEYKEYYELSELDMGTFTGTVSVLESGLAVPTIDLYMAAVQADPEAYESALLNIMDGFTVTEILSYGQWNALSSVDGSILLHDDYFFDAETITVGACYENVVGMWTYSYDEYKINPLEDGIVLVDCTVGAEDTNFGSLKSLYR